MEPVATIMKWTSNLTALMTSFRVGIMSSMRMSGGKPRSSKAGSGSVPASDKDKEQSDVRTCGFDGSGLTSSAYLRSSGGGCRPSCGRRCGSVPCY